jgi:hypothetical protein
MKKLILALIIVSLAIVFSVSVMAQSDTQDIIVADVAASEQLQNAGAVYCPYNQTGCCLIGYNSAQTGTGYPAGCCLSPQIQPPPELNPDEGDSTGTSGQIRRGCCWR